MLNTVEYCFSNSFLCIRRNIQNLRESINVYYWINSVLIDVIPKFVYTCKKWFLNSCRAE